MSSRYLYVGTSRDSGSGNKSLWKISADDGAVVWSKDHGATVRGVATDNDFVYMCGDVGSSSNTTRCYDSEGTLKWSAAHGASCYAVALGTYNETFSYYPVETVGANSSYNQTRVYDKADGTLKSSGNLYSDTTTGTCIVIKVFNEITNKYWASFFSAGAGVNAKKTGDENWTANLHEGGYIRALAVDDSENIYIGGSVTNSTTTRKFNSSRTSQWTANHGGIVMGLVVDSSGNVYTTGYRSSSITTRQYNSSGSEQWTADHGADTYAIAMDSDGNLYVGGASTGGYSIRKYTSSGSLVWSADVGPAVYALVVADETVAVTLEGSAAAKVTATGRLHVAPQLNAPPSRLAIEMIADGPEWFVPMDDYNYVLDTRYACTDVEFTDWSGHAHETLINGSTGHSTGEANSRWPVPRVAHPGVNTDLWVGYVQPSIRTDIGVATWNVENAWTVEIWRRKISSGGYYWYLGNADVRSPVLHHIYLASAWFEIAGAERKRVLYTEDTSAYARHQYVLVYDGSSTVTLYVDAVAVATLAQSIAALDVNIHADSRLYIGLNDRALSSSYPYSESRDTYSYAALYLKELSVARILQHYQAGTGLMTLPLKTLHPNIHPPFWLIRS